MSYEIEKEVYLRIYISEVASNVLTNLNLINENYEGADGTYPFLSEFLSHPDGAENKPIVARALEEALYNLRIAMQRYLISGTTVDENLLRAMWNKDTGGNEVVMNVELAMPQDFNIGVTRSLCALYHEYLVDFIVYRYLYVRIPNVASGWKAIGDIVLSEIKEVLSSRVRCVRRYPQWV